MEGISGLGGWQWIFILEGIVPVALSLIIWKLLPDSPETASFLTKSEREFVVNRLAMETGSGHGRVTNNDKISMKLITAAFKEKRIWGSWVMFWVCIDSLCRVWSMLTRPGQHHRHLRLHSDSTHDHRRARLLVRQRAASHNPDLRLRHDNGANIRILVREGEATLTLHYGWVRHCGRRLHWAASDSPSRLARLELRLPLPGCSGSILSVHSDRDLDW